MPADLAINSAAQLRGPFPKLNPNAAPIQEPLSDNQSLYMTVRQLKMAVDSLIGQTGRNFDRAATLNDLVALGLITQQQLSSSLPALGQSRVDKLETGLDKETKDRTSADDALQANIDAEVAARIADVDAEETARIAADNAEAAIRAAADALLAPIASPTFTGDPQAPTPALTDNDTSIATTAFVKGQGFTVSPATWTFGSVPFAVSTTALGQDNANLFWDDANNRLGIGTTAPGTKLDLRGDATVYGFINVTPPSGDAIISASAFSTTDRVRHQAVIPSVGTWVWGADGSDAGKFKISWNSTTLATPTVVVQSNGNVGFGLANPHVRLELAAGSNAGLAFTETGGGADAKSWDWFASSGVFSGRAVNDAYNGASQWVSVARSGYAIASVTFPGGGGVVVGAPTGGAIGTGKLNAVEVRANNVVLTSSRDLKVDIQPLANCLPLIMAIPPCTFHWQDEPGERHRGFIAQEVFEAMGGQPETLDLGGMVAVLWQAVRELSMR